MRHVVSCVGMTLAPAPGPRCVRQAAPVRALIAAGGLAPSVIAGQAPAGSAAIAVASVTVAAQHHLLATACAQELPSRSVHTHPGVPKVLDGLAPAGQTALAPPSSARCRTRHGRQARQQVGTAAASTFFGVSAVVSPARHACPAAASAPPSWPPCRAARMANTSSTIRARSSAETGVVTPSYETATSPSNKRGS